MTDAQAAEPLPQGQPTPEAVVPEPPKPEPWTAEKVSEWNGYNDLFIGAFALLLCFIASANKITQSSVWTHLQAGREIAATRSPLTTDTFSYTEEGRRWVHVPWLADLAHYEIFKLVSSLTPVDANSQVNSPAPEVVQAKREQVEKSEQWGAAGLVVLDALLRAATVLVILRIRRQGPGLWWSSVCAILALGVVLAPGGLTFGGIAGPTAVGGLLWGQLFLAIELLWLYRAFGQDRRWAFHALIPLFLLWANFDESFLVGLIVLAVTVVARGLTKEPNRDKTTQAITLKQGLIGLGICAAVCLVNPSIHRTYAAAFSMLIPSIGWVSGPTIVDGLSYFGKTWSASQREFIETERIYQLVVIGFGLASFAINHRQFKLSRFLVYVVASAFWVIALRQRGAFAVVMAATLTLNGQEWYQSLFRTEGRLGRGWAVFSTGGRAITLALFALAIAIKIIGWGMTERDLQFGFGFNPDEFRFEAAESLRDAPITGNVLNTLPLQGDATIWRASPRRKTFIDSRRHLFSALTIQKYEEVQKAIRDEDEVTWKAIFKEFNISAVMIQLDHSPRTYQALVSNKQWVPFYDDGAVVMFGQPDAPAADMAYFRANRLDADNLLYKQPRLTASSDKLPTATTDLDKIYQSRSVAKAQPHNDAAYRWLHPPEVEAGAPYLPDPAHCFMAIRELRLALSLKPDDTRAYRQLADAYRFLLLEESGLVAGIQPTLENISTLNSLPRQSPLLTDRVRQLLTALNYAIMTTPPPQTSEEYSELARLNMQLAQLYSNQGFLDLGRDRLELVLKYYERVDNVPIENLTTLTTQFTEMNNQLNEIQIRIQNMGVESQAGPLQKAAAARQVGAVGLAIANLEEARQAGMTPLQVNPMLLDLYCQTGQPEKALELWTGGNSSDVNLSDGPGTAAMRQGRVFLLLGNYSSTVSLWRREAIPRLKFECALKAPQATRFLIEGDPMATTRTFLELPEEVNRQAVWEFELGMACLEAGQPVDITAEHLANALTLTPDLSVRPVIAYYLQKLGKPVPEARKDPKAITAPTPVTTPPILSPAVVAPK